MSGVVLTVGALALDTIFRLDHLPSAPGKYLPLEAVQVAQGMATAQAATVVRLGGRARLWASLGDDAVGDRIIADLLVAGIDTSALRRVAGATSGFSSILVDRHGERMIVPHYDPAIRTRPDDLPELDDVAAVSVDVRWPAAAEIALHAARDLGVPGILDVEAAPEDVLDRLLPIATHVIASQPGALALTGEPDPAKAAAALGRSHPGFVAVTAGERGVFSSAGHQPGFAVEAVDTLAAGDVFHGAFAFGLTEGWEVPQTIRFAAAAAALKCTRFGGRLGAPTRAEVEAFLAAH
ncbi:MAG TPA: PfkB family carbohydrate kinase [Devosia sp.]|jgi:sulfofructose kinase|nr:PfkB family carbohydrate kinase [Devosia sp.]